MSSALWYSGDVLSAVQTVMKNKGVLIVLVHGDCDDSRSMVVSWQDERISQLLNGKNYVALKLEQNSPSAAQFKEIYPVCAYPSTYFIQSDGKVLEQSSGKLSLVELEEKVKKYFHPISVSQPSSIPKAEGRVEKQTSVAKKAPLENKADSKKSVEEARRKYKAKKKQDDELLQQLRNQIEMDRRERQSALSKNQTLNGEVRKRPVSSMQKSQPTIVNNHSARVQCRFPDGSKLEETFKENDLFEKILQMVEGQLGSGCNFKLVSLFPRREYKRAEGEKSMEELGLTPSAVLLVVLEPSGVVRTSGLLSRIFDTLNNWFFSPLLRNIYAILFWILPTQSIQQNPDRVDNREGDEGFNRQPSTLKRGDSDDEDSNAKWNGNSTQQL